MQKGEQPILDLLKLALVEDVGKSDITSDSIIPKNLILKGCVFAKESGCIAGLQAIRLFYDEFYKKVEVTEHVSDGTPISKGDRIVCLRGPGRDLLATERLALNVLQRMSGIATQTRLFIEQVHGTRAVILDTRKTAPGLRALDKLAVKIGGGTNHRLGLFDSYLIKENHIEAAGGLKEAVRRAQGTNTGNRMVEVEVRSLSELKEALGLDVDRILLDNMSTEQLTGGKIPLEASGNVTLENVRRVAETGVDFISVGSLTHSVRVLDLSFIIEKN